MNIEVFVICDAATDSMGKLNILGAFDTIFVQSIPYFHPQCAVALKMRFRRIEQGQHHVIIHLVDEDGNLVLPPLDGNINVVVPQTELSAGVNVVLNMQGLKFERFGEYAINLAIDGRQESTLPLYIKEAPVPISQPTQGQ